MSGRLLLNSFLCHVCLAPRAPPLPQSWTDLCHSDEMGNDSGPLRRRGLAEHHELYPLRNAVEERDEALQDRVVHGAAMHHKAVVVLELGGQGRHWKA